MNKPLETHGSPPKMADPNDLEKDTAENTSLSADDRFASLVNQSRGLRSEFTGESVVGESLVEKAVKLKTIRSRFMTNVLPILLFPLLLMGLLAIAGLGVLGSRTNAAVGTTDEILVEHNAVVEEELSEAADNATAFVDGFLTSWFERVSTIEDASAPAAEVATNISSPLLGTTDGLSDERSLRVQEGVQVVFTTPTGELISHSNPDLALDDYAGADWLVQAVAAPAANSVQFRSFVVDQEDGTASLEFSRALSDGNVMQIRVPFENLHAQLDRAVGADGYDLALIDTASSVVLADTSTMHAEGSVFITATDFDDTMTSSANFDAMEEGFSTSDESVTATSPILSDSSLFASEADGANLPGVEWVLQASEPLDSISTSLLSFRDVAEDVNEQQRVLSVGLAFIMAISAIVAFFALRRSARQISEPVERLSVQAQTAADVGIPSIVEAARTSDELPELDEFAVDSNDELTILAASLNTMQDAAVDLAAGQAQLRRQNVSRTFVSLGRRNQNLLNRQLEFIEELESQERDADALENLFRLDHLATRMRRNAENLLVLAGEQTPRRWGKPIAVRDVLRAAASEIADYRRVRLGDIDPATVSGNLATDLSHLFAELLENAGSFSPPTTPIEVFGQQADSHYRLAIVDQGIGMDEASLEEINERLANPVDFADAPSAYLGLFVVSRLAQEMGVTVRLSNADPTGEGHRRGTIAFIDLPNALLSSDQATDQSDQKASEAVSRRADAIDAAQADPASAPAISTPEPVAEAPTVDEPAATPEPAESPEPAVAETTTAGFPKRSKGSTSVKTEPEKFVSDTPANADEDVTATSDEAVTASSDEAVTATSDEAVTAEAAPADSAAETTTAGFPKRSKGATSIKTEPDKLVSSKPANADEAVTASSDEAVTASSDEVVTATSDEEVTAEAAPADKAGETTTAGFPKRSKGATSIKSEPDKLVSSKPVDATERPPIERDAKSSAIALVNAAKAKARKVAAEEAAAAEAAGGDAPTEQAAAEAAPAPAEPQADVPTTAAGFPKRGESKSTSSLPAPTTNSEAAPQRSRDAEAVKNSLMSYRSAVARGRGEGQDGDTPAETATPATVGATDQDNDDARPGSA